MHSLLRSLEHRRHLAQLLKDNCLVESGDEQITAWLKDEGFATTVGEVTAVLQVSLSRSGSGSIIVGLRRGCGPSCLPASPVRVRAD